MGSVSEKWTGKKVDFSNITAPGEFIRETLDHALHQLGGDGGDMLRISNPDEDPTSILISDLEKENKRVAKEKADIEARALMDTQARLMRESMPGMATKNKTLLTGPQGLADSIYKPKKTIEGA